MKACRSLFALLLVALACCLAQAKQLAIITDPANPVGELSAAELTKIFNGHMQAWPDGKPIRLVIPDPSSAEMRLVLRKLGGSNPEQVQASLQSRSPQVVVAGSDDAVLKSVSATRGALGVVDLFAITKDVKVLKIDGKLPVEPGYVLRGNTQ